MEKITAKLMDIKYPPEETDRREREGGTVRMFYVLTVFHEGNSVKAVGECPFRPNENAVYELAGDWTLWNGLRQFKFKGIEERIPVDSRQLLSYACELTPGFGEGTAQAIWDALGENWQHIQEGDVPRVNERKIAALMDTLETLELHRQQTEAMVFLAQHNCTRKMAEAAWARHTLSTIPRVNANCYILADLPNYGFKAVDNGIRQAFGIEDGDPRRIDAAVGYCFGEMTASGDTVVSWTDYWNAIRALLPNVPEPEIYARIAKAFSSGDFILFDGTDEFTSRRLHGIESFIWDYARRRA